MKRKAFIRELVTKGCYLKRRGKRHDIYMNSRNGKKVPVPRHTELKDSLCDLIKAQLDIS